MKSEIEKLSRIFKSLGDTNRLIILKMLRDKELCACKILEDLNISQSTLSHHMKLLCDCGLVECRKEGKWSHYSLNREEYDKLKKELDLIFY